MRLTFSWSVFLFFTTSLLTPLFAQQKPLAKLPQACGTQAPSVNQREEIERLAQAALRIKRASGDAATQITYVPIRPHIFRRSDGSGGFSLAAMNNVMALTNSYYLRNGFGIQFYYAGTSPDYIDDDARYPVFNYDDEDGMVGNTSVPNAMNQYYLQKFSNGIGGYAYFPYNNASSTRSFILVGGNETEEDLGNRLIPHELGHNFNLYHTFQGNGTVQEELVTRNTGEVSPRQSANCGTGSIGDLLCDTPADPYGKNGASTSTSSNSICLTYTGTTTDANGDSYMPSLTNIMSYFFPCVHDFTPGQYDRIDAGLALRQSHSTYTLNFPATTMTAPSNLVASTGQSGWVSLRWQDNATNEMGFFIERASLATGPFIPIGGVGPDITTFTDTKITTGQTYYYRIRPSNTTTGALSNVATISTVKTPTCKPTFSYGASTTEPDGLKSVLLNGEALSINSGQAANGYTEFTGSAAIVAPGQVCTLTGSLLNNYATEGYAVWLDLNRNGQFESGEQVATGTTTGNLAGMLTIPNSTTAGALAMRIIVLRNGLIASSSTACSNFAYGEAEDYTLTVQASACSIPTNLTTTAAATTAQLGWSAASGATAYNLRWRPQGSTTWINVSGLTATTYSLTGLTNATLYQWQVSTTCVSGSSVWAGTRFNTSCPGPTSTTTTSVGETTATIAWSGGNTPYELAYHVVPSGSWHPISLTTSPYTVTGLLPATSYEWRIRSVCNADVGSLPIAGTFNTIGSCRPTFAIGCSDNDGLNTFVFSGTTLSENTGCSAGAYSSYNAVAPLVTAGTSYSFTGVLLGDQYPEGVTIWIDSNRDGQFASNEQVFATPSKINGTDTFTGNLTIPSGLSPGPLAMRIIVAYDKIPTAGEACGTNYGYGEAEDYQLSIPAACSVMASVKNGTWNDPTTWSCNRVPIATDAVQIKHLVTMPTSYTGHAKMIKYDAGTQVYYIAGSQLQLHP